MVLKFITPQSEGISELEIAESTSVIFCASGIAAFTGYSFMAGSCLGSIIPNINSSYFNFSSLVLDSFASVKDLRHR